MDFAGVLSRLSDFFDGRGIRYGVVGAIGLHAYGLTRATGDLDFVVEASAQADLLQYLDSLGYERLYVSEGYSNHLHSDVALGRLDFVYADAQTANALFAGSKQMELFPGRKVPVPRAEHLAAMKVLAMKNDPSRAFREMADIQLLLSIPTVNEQEIRSYFERHGLLERFNEIKRAMANARP